MRQSEVTPHAKLSSLEFWKSYGITLRPYLLFVSGFTGLVGLAAGPPSSPLRFWSAFFAFFFSYGFGQALTDVSQVDTDSISSPYRPLTRGIITRSQVLFVSLAGFGLCSLVLLLCSVWAFLLYGVAVVGLALYTPSKRLWFLGPVWNSWIVGALPIVGFLCVSGSPNAVFNRPLLWSLSISSFAFYAVFVVLGYLKDVSADRATGYRTIPVVYGWSATVMASFVFLGLGVAALGFFLKRELIYQRASELQPVAILAMALAALAVIVNAASHLALLRIRDERDVQGPLAWVLRSYLYVHIAQCIALRSSLVVPVFALYLAFELILALRPDRRQI